MNKYVFNILSNLLDEVKKYNKYENLDKIKAILNNEVGASTCKAVILNSSPRAGGFFGLIVYPNIKLGNSNTEKIKISDYVIEIQKSLMDLLEPTELAAMIIHDISHNILTTTVVERFKMAIYKACKMTNSKIVEIIHNIETKMYNLAILDISNRTYKAPVVEDLDMYEPDRLLVDMGICSYWNSALDKLHSLDETNLSDPNRQDIMDAYMGTKLIKMIQEKIKGVDMTYNQLVHYIESMYDTGIFTYYPAIQASVSDNIYGQDVSGIETLKPLELQFLTEWTIGKIRQQKDTVAALVLESIFDNPNKISYSSLQKELDIINFKMDAITSNYERLAILDRIYDNIFSLEKYIKKNPSNTIVPQYLEKFIKLTVILKDAKVSKKRYDIFVEVPAGYIG